MALVFMVQATSFVRLSSILYPPGDNPWQWKIPHIDRYVFALKGPFIDVFLLFHDFPITSFLDDFPPKKTPFIDDYLAGSSHLVTSFYA